MKKKTINDNQLVHQDDGEGDQTSGGTTKLVGKIDFGIPKRDDLLSSSELNRLIAIHSTEHEIRVIKQKELLEARQQLKDQPRKANQAGIEQTQNSNYPPHPILFNKSQFSGATDPKISPLPDQNNSQTNEGSRDEKRLEYKKEYTPENAPKLNPKIQNTLTSTPRLTK